ncbi:hypothetical protein BpHYR1_005831 [Brachionus plicatilis]|uniref:Uncharacterized protein n=1 Tax=Brachionus plicatilis TaxID=10195 RepID=A0A3M7SG52_BRAPC|nr:hypothetical protein BpHYR1_005831 [Brachionus plicatilis]
MASSLYGFCQFLRGVVLDNTRPGRSGFSPIRSGLELIQRDYVVMVTDSRWMLMMTSLPTIVNVLNIHYSGVKGSTRACFTRMRLKRVPVGRNTLNNI